MKQSTVAARPSRWGIVCWVATMLCSSAAFAVPSPADLAAAETLFREGKDLMNAGKYDQACPKLRESLRLDPIAGGTLLTLALCHEGEGKTASAWAEFNDAKAAAIRDGRKDRESIAQQHIDALEPKLSHLTIQVPPAVAAIDGIQVQRDGIELGRAAWGVAVPVDPGSHKLTSTAPGRESWTDDVMVKSVADNVVITLPALAPIAAKPLQSTAPSRKPAPKPGRSEPEPDKASTHGTPVLGYVIGGVGILGLSVGSYFGLQAISKRNDVEKACPNNACTSQNDIDKNDEAKSAATISNIALGVGLAGTIVGGYLLFGQDEESDDKAGVAWSAGAGPSGAEVSLKGVW